MSRSPVFIHYKLEGVLCWWKQPVFALHNFAILLILQVLIICTFDYHWVLDIQISIVLFDVHTPTMKGVFAHHHLSDDAFYAFMYSSYC